MGNLTAARVRSVNKPGRYIDGNTLMLVVAPGGSKSWIQRLTIRGKRHDIGLGGYPLVTLAEAREIAFENRRIARRGGDPRPPKVAVPTFAECAEKVYEAKLANWRSEKVRRNWRDRLDKYALPRLGTTPVDSIGRDDVLGILAPIWGTKRETARKVRTIIREVLAMAMASGHIETNIAGEAIDGALPKQKPSTVHHRALPYAELPDALAVIDGYTPAKLALRFLVLTAGRSGEVRGATWDEIDLDRREWRISAERMKAKNEHRVPLSDAALDVLERARQYGDGLVFPSAVRPGQQMSDMTLTKVLRDAGLADRATVHGMRSAFRDWCADTGKPREIAEAALAHVVGGVEGAYFRSDMLERRRGVMEAWARHCTRQTAEVVSIRA
ncbi:MAG: tyrosine-type recombinase/integrase [Gammaproteobacteria bacterium]|nr:tyrosine-type recombinase/integrase [Gammaproteobacteria bacterium]